MYHAAVRTRNLELFFRGGIWIFDCMHVLQDDPGFDSEAHGPTVLRCRYDHIDYYMLISFSDYLYIQIWIYNMRTRPGFGPKNIPCTGRTYSAGLYCTLRKIKYSTKVHHVHVRAQTVLLFGHTNKCVKLQI